MDKNIRIDTQKKAMKLFVVLIITNLIFIPSYALCEDYPEGYSGSGYREYLSSKIQNGYYVDVFKRIDMLQKERVSKRNQVETIIGLSYQAASYSNNKITETENLKSANAAQINTEIALMRRQRLQTAYSEGEFTYIPYSDGKVVYFKDGLVSRVMNERVIDEFGNVSKRDSYNYKYDEKRLLVGFESDTKDPLGNITHARQYGIRYSADSLFYADKDTNANKNTTEYFVEEIDSAGNKKVTHFYGGIYDGKFLRAFSQTIDDSVYGNASFTRYNIRYNGDPDKMVEYSEDGVEGDVVYTLHRSNITYNDRNQILSYHDERKNTDPLGQSTTIITDALFTYNTVDNPHGKDVADDTIIPNQLMTSTIITRTSTQYGATQTTVETKQYNYTNNILTGATGHTAFKGRENDILEYTDSEDHVLTVQFDGTTMIAAWYLDANGNKVNVSLDKVTTTLKPGQRYEGTTVTNYEVVGFTPMAKDSSTITSYLEPGGLVVRTLESTIRYSNGLVNNIARLLSTDEHSATWYNQADTDRTHLSVRDINTRYLYDAKGNLTGNGAIGTGTGTIYDDPAQAGGWLLPRNAIITVTYGIYNGRVLQINYNEEQNSN